MNWMGYAITVLLSAFIGWATIRIAIHLLFHPLRPMNIAGIRIQGIFPKLQPEIAERLGDIAAKEVLSLDKLEEKIGSAESLDKIRPEIESHIDDFLRNRLKEVFPMLSMLIGDKTINQLKGAFLSELETLFPILMKNYAGKLQKDIDVKQIVQQKITALDPVELERMVMTNAKNKIRSLELLFAGFGLVVGLLQVVILVLTN